MADEKKNSNKPDEMIKLAHERFEASSKAEASNRIRAIEALRFINGEQWTPEATAARKNRIMLTENRLPSFIDQVVGDQRQNKPRIKVRPVDSKSDPAVASVFMGMIRNIENTSQADSIRDYAFEQAVSCGWGYYGLHTRYCDENSFDQEIYHRYISNQFSVYDDPSAKLPDKSDRKWCFVTDTLSRDDFKAKYPDAIDGWEQGLGELYSDWFTEDGARIAEYWYVKPKKVKVALLSNGEVLPATEAESAIANTNTVDTTGAPLSIVKERTTEINEIYSCIISGKEVLEGPTLWPGKYTPLIYVGGKELNVEGQQVRRGLVEWAKDPQRMHNYWLTTTTEMIALQPKAPWMLTPEQVEGHETMWAEANTSNKPYLLYNNVGGALPQRQSLNMLPQGTFDMMQQSIDGMKATMGMYDASLGKRGNETSGKAILARQKEGDVGTFAFVDNLSRAIAFEGRIHIDLIPKIYDTAKIVRIINPDDTEKFVMVNQQLRGENVGKYGVNSKAQEGTIYDLSVGKYDVVCETGPSYSTQRMEAADNMVHVIQAAPDLMKIAGDLLFKNLDWPGANEISDRLKKTLPPGMATGEDGRPVPPPPPPPPQPPTPEMMLEAEKLKLEFAKLDVEKMKIIQNSQNLKNNIREEVLNTLKEVFPHPGQDMMDKGERSMGQPMGGM